MPAYGPPMPMMPYYGPAAPMPPGYGPMPPYPMQPMPPAPMTQVLPAYSGSAPKASANEPYAVQPDPARAKPAPTDETPATPPFRAPGDEGPVLHDGPIIDAGPNEPYTIYEGRRYRADVKHDNERVWMQASYIHWWVRGDSTPPLVSAGINGSLGAIGDPGTSILLGGNSIGARNSTRIQAMVGMWLDCEKLCSVEFGGFWVGNSNKQYRFASDANGNPILCAARPDADGTGAPHLLPRLLQRRHGQHHHGLPRRPGEFRPQPVPR